MLNEKIALYSIASCKGGELVMMKYLTGFYKGITLFVNNKPTLN